MFFFFSYFFVIKNKWQLHTKSWKGKVPIPNPFFESTLTFLRAHLGVFLVSHIHPPTENPSNTAKHTTTLLLFLHSFSHSPYLENTSILLLISPNSFLLESNTNYHYNLSNSFKHLFLHISYKIPILITHTNYKYIPQNIYFFYHLHIFKEISITHTKSPSHGRHKLLILKSY